MLATPVVFHVLPAQREQYRLVFGEEGATPDTDLVCDLIVELHKISVALTGNDALDLRAKVTAETEAIGMLRVTNVPALSLVGCANMQRTGHANTVQDILCVFRHHQTDEPLDSGCVDIHFWRSAVAPDKRRVTIYAPPETPLELAALPLWDEKHVGGANFATDRARLVDVIRCVRNMHAVMPIGIETSLDLVFPTDFSGKRKRADERTDSKRRGAARDDSTHAAHVGYCLIFQHPIALPAVSESFMAHMKQLIGPALINWVVTFPQTRKLGADNVRRRGESLAVVLRRSDCPDADVAPFSITGTKWLARQVKPE